MELIEMLFLKLLKRCKICMMSMIQHGNVHQIFILDEPPFLWSLARRTLQDDGPGKRLPYNILSFS